MKNNWPAVALFIAPGLVHLNIHRINPDVRSRFGNFVLMCIWIILSFGILAVRLLILTGFLRMAHLYGRREQKITKSLKAGAYFFRRLLLFIMMYVAAQVVLGLVFMRLMNAQFVHSGLAKLVGLAHVICAVILTFALMKLLLLVPALIIVRDCTILEGVKSVKEYKLFEQKWLVFLFVVYQLCSFLFGPLLPLKGYSGIFIRFYAGTIIKSLLLVIIGLSAVDFVGRLGIQADNE